MEKSLEFLEFGDFSLKGLGFLEKPSFFHSNLEKSVYFELIVRLIFTGWLVFGPHFLFIKQKYFQLYFVRDIKVCSKLL